MANKTTANQKQTPAKFEDAIKRLEEIVDALDSRDVELDKALALFEEGAALVKFCSAKLEETKKKIEILLNKDGTLKAVPFKENAKISDKDTFISEETPSGNNKEEDE